MSMPIQDYQAKINLYLTKKHQYYAFNYRKKVYRFKTLEKVHLFFLKQTDLDSVKIILENKNHYIHLSMGNIEVYDTKEELRRIISQEGRGFWIEKKDGHKKYFVDESTWAKVLYKQVSQEACLSKFNAQKLSTFAKVLGIGFGVLSLTSEILEFEKYASKIIDNFSNIKIPNLPQITTGLMVLEQRNPTLGVLLVAFMESKVRAQPIGMEFQVNTYTMTDQWSPSIGSLSNGGFVVVWTSCCQDGDSYGVYGQRYDALGNKSGLEFQVNSYSSQLQSFPSIRSQSNGSFVVVWQSQGQDGDSYGVYGQRYDALGQKVGIEFQINSYSTSVQGFPSISSASDGSFVVVWHSFGQDGSSYGIFGQRYNALGQKVGLEFQVNTATGGLQDMPCASMLSDGGFVIVWESQGQDGSGFGVYGQRYDALGNKSGLEFLVNTYTSNSQHLPSVCVLLDGSFVIVWGSCCQDGESYGIFGQRYDALGNKLGIEFQVNTVTPSVQDAPSISSLLDGGFIVVWDSELQDATTTTTLTGLSRGIYGQRYDALGNKLGIEFQVNTYTISDQGAPRVCSISDGGFVVVWNSFGQDGDSYGVYGQRYDKNGIPIPLEINLPSSITKTSLSSFSNNQNNLLSISTMSYGQTYQIIQNGIEVGSFYFEGGVGMLDSSKENVLILNFYSNFATNPGDEIILFTIPKGQEAQWESIKIQGEEECLKMTGDIRNENGQSAYLGIFEVDDQCVNSALSFIPYLTNTMLKG